MSYWPPSSQPPPSIAGHLISEFDAKMQSYPVITSAQPEVELFQGTRRSTVQPLSNRRGPMYMEFTLDFWGANSNRQANRTTFEGLLIGPDLVWINILDGYFYHGMCVEIGDPVTLSELVTSVRYRFRVTRHWPEVTVDFNSSKDFNNAGNVERTDCILTIHPIPVGAPIINSVITLNGLTWGYAPELTGDLILDGVHKTFTVGGVDVSTTIEWTDFPYLVPGANHVAISFDGIFYNFPCTIVYLPTFM